MMATRLVADLVHAGVVGHLHRIVELVGHGRVGHGRVGHGRVGQRGREPGLGRKHAVLRRQDLIVRAR